MSADPVLACQNESFLDSNDGRPLRILAEYLQPLRAFRRERVYDTIAFFGSARLREDGPLGRYYAEAREFAASVHRRSRNQGTKKPGNQEQANGVNSGPAQPEAIEPPNHWSTYRPAITVKGPPALGATWRSACAERGSRSR